jgi:hypothetical protein
MGTRCRTCLVGAGCTLAMLCHVAETWDKQDNDCVCCALRIAKTPGSDVTTCSNENPSITPLFLVVYLE